MLFPLRLINGERIEKIKLYYLWLWLYVYTYMVVFIVFRYHMMRSWTTTVSMWSGMKCKWWKCASNNQIKTQIKCVYRTEKFLKLQHKDFIWLYSSVHTNTRYYEPGFSLKRLKATTNILHISSIMHIMRVALVTTGGSTYNWDSFQGGGKNTLIVIVEYSLQNF